MKYVVAMLCGVSLSGSVYMAGWGSQKQGEMTCTGQKCGEDSLGQAMATADQAGKVDVKNTRCIVTGEDIGSSKETVEYQGKLYHICCHDCVADFNKAPEKYVKILEANPGKYGVQ